MPSRFPRARSAPAARRGSGALLLAALLIALPSPLFAQTGQAAQHGSSEAVFIAQIILLLLCGRLLGEGMQRIGQPAIMGQLLSGVLLGPSVLGTLWPGAEQALSLPRRFGTVGELLCMGCRLPCTNVLPRCRTCRSEDVGRITSRS
jgi:hypothetical protein